MESQRATMNKLAFSWAGATPLHGGLPEEIVIWEILVRLPPKSLLRCRAVCRAWRHATSTRLFLEAHHHHQPSLPIVISSEYSGPDHKDILVFHHRAAGVQLQPVTRLSDFLCVDASCDGLLILRKCGLPCDPLSICNPATREHAPLGQLSGFGVLGMYAHRPTGEYRILLHQTSRDQIFCYVFVLGSNQPPRHIGAPEVAASASFSKPALVRDSLHWYPVHYRHGQQLYRDGSKVVIIFDTTSESFRHMRAPVVPAESSIFEMDGTLGIYNYQDKMKIVDIWMLQNYESEVWTYKYKVVLPAVEIKQRFGRWLNYCYVSVHSVDGDVLLLLNQGGCMFHVDIKGKLVHHFRRVGQYVAPCESQLKQTLVAHTFFTTLEGYGVNVVPFV